MKGRSPRLILLLFLVYSSVATATIRYVNVNNANPMSPYTDWSTAATTIQDAIDAAATGDLILVTNGVYFVGGRALSPSDVANRIVATNAVMVESVNGPAVTVIQGEQVPGTMGAANAVRCALLGGGAFLSGFTLTGGEAGLDNYINGGGIYAGLNDPSAVVSNCVLNGNTCAGGGGGVAGGTLIDCVLTGNLASGGGAAYDAVLIRCTANYNAAGWAGATLGCTASNCLLAGNSATNYGGGSGYSTLVNCTVAANSLQPGYNGNGGGSYHDTLVNSVVYTNTAPNGPNYSGSSLQYCCTWPLPPSGVGNLATRPVFAPYFYLSSNSPCINAGKNSAVSPGATDLDGNPRVVGGTVDIGAYEFQSPATIISSAWLQQYGFPTDGSADFADPDNDGMNNWQEWVAGTDPTNALSVLRLVSVTNGPSGTTISWQSVNTRNYLLQRASNLAAQPAFATVATNLVGMSGITAFSDTNASEPGPYFYRVGVPCAAVTTSGVSWTALYLSTRGAGSITPFYFGEMLQAGTNYVMTAIPAPGYSFTNWNPVTVFTFTTYSTTTNPPIVSIVAQPQTNFIEGAVLHFTMQPEQVILTTPGIRTVTKGVGWQANFVAQ